MNARRSIRSTFVRLGWAAVGVGLISVSVVGPAASAVPPIEVRAIDARGGQVIVDVYAKNSKLLTTADVAIAGKPVKATISPLAETLPPVAVVVLDNSASLSNGTVQLAKASIAKLLPGTGNMSRLGVVTTGGGARTLLRPTADAAAVTAAVDPVSPTGGSRLWDGVVLASDLLAASGETQRNIIVISGSADLGGGSTFTEAASAARAAGASAHIIAVSGATAPTELLNELHDALGGTIATGADSTISDLAAATAGRVANQYRMTVVNAPKLSTEFAPLVIDAGGVQTRASYRPGVSLVGAESLAYVASPEEAGGLFGSGAMKWIIVLFGAVAAAGLAFSLAQLAMKRNNELDAALRHYDDTYGAVGVAEVDGEALAQSALLKRAVAMTGNLAEKRGFLTRVATLLERADLPLRPAEALFFYLAFSVLSIVVTLFLTGNLFVTLIAGVVTLVLPSISVDFLAKRRKKKFVRVLPDMLQLLSGTLRAGYSIGQGFESVSTEVSEPMGKELRRAVMEARLGRPLEEALASVSERMDSDDFEWAVMAIRIQREVGGNLAELLMTVADTMTQRERLRRDVAALTAEGKMSAIILGMLPPGLMLAMYVMNPDYIAKLFTGTGLFLMGGAVLAMFIGFFWMKKCITIEV